MTPGSPEHLRALAARRKARYANLAQTLQDGMDRTANVWNFNQKSDNGTLKASENPGFDATELVSEVVAEYKIAGTYTVRSTRSERRAGKGAHGITDGQVTVEVQITPSRGATQTIEVPVQIRNGYLIRPGVFVHEETPYVFAQSSVDEIIELGTFWEDPQLDRRNIYDTPTKRAGRQEMRLTAELAIPSNGTVLALRPGTIVSMVSEDDTSLHLQSESGIMFRLAREHVDMTLELV